MGMGQNRLVELLAVVTMELCRSRFSFKWRCLQKQMGFPRIWDNADKLCKDWSMVGMGGDLKLPKRPFHPISHHHIGHSVHNKQPANFYG